MAFASQLALLVCVLLLQVAQASASVINVAKGKIDTNPKCCYGCKACYDANNQNRYTELTNKKPAALAAWTKLCSKTTSSGTTWTLGKGTSCKVLDGAKVLKNNASLAVKASTLLAFRNAGIKAYRGAKIALQRNSGLDLIGSGLNLTGARLDITSPDTWTTLANGTLTLTRSTVRAAASRLFAATFVTLTLNDSDFQINNTVTAIDRTRVVIARSQLAIGASRATASPKPYPATYPLTVTSSYIDLRNGVLRLVNLQDAYFLYTTIKARSGAITLINSNVRFFDSVFDLSDITLTLTNSTLLLNKVEFKTDQYFSFSNGTFTGLPKPKYPAGAFDDYTFSASGTGSIGLKSTTV